MKFSRVMPGVLAAVTLAGCGGAASSSSSGPVATTTTKAATPIKVGVMTNDTGTYAPLGTEVKNAVQMMFDQVNQQGGVNGHPIDPVYLDGQTNPNLAATQAQQLVTDHVAAVVGLEFGTAAHAAAPILAAAHIPVLTVTADESISSPVNPWIFDVSTATILADQRDLSYMKCKGITKVAVLHDTEALGVEGAKDLNTLAANYGVQVVANQSYDLTGTNFVNQLTAIGNTSAQGIVYWGVGTAPGIIVKEYHSLNMKQPLMTSPANADPSFLAQVGASANGMLAVATNVDLLQHLPSSVADPSALLAFTAKYKQDNNQPFGALAGLGHDASLMLITALKAGATTASGIQAKLSNMSITGFDGIEKFTSTNHSALQVSDMVMTRVVDGVVTPTTCQ